MISFSPELDTARSIDLKAPDAGDSFVRALAGDWHGRGFSLGVWPSRQAAQPCFLEMHRTSESLVVAPVGDASDGDGAPEPSTLVFDQNVSDTISGVPLVREAGMWFAHPASSHEREAGQTLTLISTGSNGEVTIASGDIARSAFAEPAIPPINTAPFAVDAPGARSRHAGRVRAVRSRGCVGGRISLPDRSRGGQAIGLRRADAAGRPR